jgi:hypothetical protein
MRSVGQPERRTLANSGNTGTVCFTTGTGGTEGPCREVPSQNGETSRVSQVYRLVDFGHGEITLSFTGVANYLAPK